MRNVDYIIIDETHLELRSYRSGKRHAPNFGNHYAVSARGQLLTLLDRRKRGCVSDAIRNLNSFDQQMYDDSSVGVLYYGSIAEDFAPTAVECPKRRKTLMKLLLYLRDCYPDAKILGVSEIDGKYIRAQEGMNDLRRALAQ